MSIYTLALESSCDETSASVLKDGRTVLSNVISSQVPIHRKFGGVVPEIASRHHIEQVIPVIDQALRDANVTLQDIDHIGVTYGPGLVGALLVGVAAAKGLSFATGIPLIPVHHMEGHIFANFLANPELEPPFLSLVVSGGHTMLVHVKGYEEFDILGQTRDDAAGEAFDKIARVMGFPYPGGPHIDALALEGNPDAIEFPKALSEPGNFEFSFSGLKSAVLNYLNSKQQKNEPINQADVAASFQKAIVDVLVEKTRDAAHILGETRITIAGGVSANKGLQMALQKMCEKEGFTYYKPHKILSTDNAAMIGCRAYYMAQAGKFADLTLNAKPSVEIGHVSWKLISFGESLTRQRIQIFTPLLESSQGTMHQRADMLCIERSEQGVITRQLRGNNTWHSMMENGQPLIGVEHDQRQHVFPVVDNGGRIIGGIAFTVSPSIKIEQYEQEYTLSDTMQRLMLTATDEQIQSYEPISYFDGLIIFDDSHRILYGNEAAIQLVDLLGFDRRLVGSSIYSSTLKVSAIQQVLDDRTIYTSEEIYQDMVIRQHMIPIAMGRNETRCFLVLHDCTRESKQQQELLVKNSIIKEVHHRVKNNLQTVAGLLRMEARRSSLPEVKQALQEGINRIESMALVHDIVSHYDEDYIGIRSIYDELCRLLRMSMVRQDQEVTFTYSGEDMLISSHMASYVSLIINELITNSLEHGLDGKNGEIRLAVTESEEYIVLAFSDTGKGLPPEFSINSNKRLGLTIINNLVTHELKGKLSVANTGVGVLVTIHMKKEK